jgi:flagellar FliJ protein
MKSKESHIGMEKPLVDERRRKVDQIERMIAEFERAADELGRQINTEQDRYGIQDPDHFAYPMYAKTARQRREKLQHSAHMLKLKLEEAKALLDGAFEETPVEPLDPGGSAQSEAGKI